MPYKSEKLKLKPEHDRRRKLNPEQYDEIREKYATGLYSHRKLAAEYRVSKSTIGIIVNPDRAAKVHERIKEHWKDYRPTKEEWNEIQREHRKYKQKLYLEGKLIEENID